MPLHILDIRADGTAQAAPDNAPEGPDAYRWFHFDMADPALASWTQAHLPDLAAAALLEPETRPRCDRLGEGVILNLRAVNLNPGQSVDQMASIRLWVTPRTIVTVRVRRVFSLDDIRKAAGEGDAPPDTGSFLATLVDLLARRMRDEMLRLEAEVEALETALDEDRADAPALKDPRRRVIRFLRYMQPQKDALARLMALDVGLLDDATRMDLREGANQVLVATEALQAQKSRLEALQDYLAAQNAERMARNSYGLSLVAAVFLPLGFLTGLFGVNVGGMPGVDSPAAFAALTLGLIATGGLCIVVLRWLRML